MKQRGLVLAGLCLVGLGGACAGPAGIVWDTQPGSQTSDGLQRVRWSDVGALFLRPGAQLGGYHSVLLVPLQIAPEAPGEERRAFLPTPYYLPTPDYLERMQGLYRDTFSDQLSGNGFALATEPGPGVLRLAGYVIDLVLTAPLDPQDRPRQSEIVRSFGELTLVLDLRDSVSGMPLLRSYDREQLSSDPLQGAFVNSIGAQIAAQRQVFDHDAMLLRIRLQELKQLPALPPAPAAGT